MSEILCKGDFNLGTACCACKRCSEAMRSMMLNRRTPPAQVVVDSDPMGHCCYGGQKRRSHCTLGMDCAGWKPLLATAPAAPQASPDDLIAAAEAVLHCWYEGAEDSNMPSNMDHLEAVLRKHQGTPAAPQQGESRPSDHTTGWHNCHAEDNLKQASVRIGKGDAQQGEAEPVAVVGADYALFWIGDGPIAPIIEKHDIKVGDKLYAAPKPATEPLTYCCCGECTETGGVSARRPEEEAEQFIQAAIDNAPEPLRRLGEYLTRVLDEDQWPTAERLLLAIATTAPQPTADESRAALPTDEDVERALNAKVCEGETVRSHIAWGFEGDSKSVRRIMMHEVVRVILASARTLATEDESRAAFDFIKAAELHLEECPCECSDKRRYEDGEHMSHCHLFDLSIAHDKYFHRKPALPQDAASMDDLAMLVRRLAQHLRKAAPGNGLSIKALDYLDSHDLRGDPLRTLARPVKRFCDVCKGSGEVGGYRGGNGENGGGYETHDCPHCGGTGEPPTDAEIMVMRRDANAGRQLHASLCRRFDYSHDEVDWYRDLVSLEEHIAKRIARPVGAVADEPAYAPCEKLLALADRIDHEELWRLPGMHRDKLTDDQQARLAAGVNLRRYAGLLGEKTWRIFPPKPGISFSAKTLDKAVSMARESETEWSKRNLASCRCDRYETCDVCHPPEWRAGGKYANAVQKRDAAIDPARAQEKGNG